MLVESKSVKKFIIHPHQFTPDLCKSMEMVDGRRIYTTNKGDHFPSITTILSATMPNDKKNILNDWQERVGIEEAEKIKEDAADRGTILHNLMELYIFGHDYKTELKKHSPKVQRLFNQFKEVLDKDLTEVRLLEKPLYSNGLKIAGKVDMVGIFQNKLSVIDFKTSTRAKTMQDISDYYLQETLYSVSYAEHFGEKVDAIITIIGTEKSLKPLVYIDSPKKHLTKLIERVNYFYKLEGNKK